LVGEDPLLGQGIPTSGVKLAKTPLGYSTTLSLPASTTFLYTFAIIPSDGGNPILDASPKRTLVTPQRGSVSRLDTFK